MTIALNTTAPTFTLKDQNGKEHSLEEYRGKWVLLFFYPKDDTPGCTIEACSVRDAKNDFAEHGIHVFGISKDSVQSHEKFASKHRLNFPILSDSEGTVLEAYDVWKEKSMFGKTFMGIRRDSFLINPEGVVVKRYEKVKPEDHVAEVLSDMEQFTS